ncbi:calmodulin-binding protein 60 A-like [Rhododendron vialii]|uniref:calmodulin-binding protein 60 A-like n=1 Tax=Rhododendron vialii TaxID=182163 RepID=UPI00265E9E4A|nr:calmodulin-binding protein 60 A-like [Rhododendron vialii]
MPQKRQQQNDCKAPSDGNPSEDKRRKLPSLRNVILEVMSLRKVQLCVEPVLEPLIRKVVKEEVELALRKYLSNMNWNTVKERESFESRSLQLQFLPKISLPIFTGSRIEGEDCNTLTVALVDGLTGQVVYFGPESSAKVEIVVLEGDFDGDERGNWTLEEFNNNIVRERVGKKPLLTGDLFLALEAGIGLVGEVSFTDNSSWTRSRKFRLGARVVDNFEGVRVKEAKTESFIVRDHRGELYKKHHPPSLDDEVWRLEKIGKDGAFHKRLNREKVNSVKDFLILLFLDPTRLRNILGTGMSTKMWEVTVDHAQTCILDPRWYFYSPGSQQKTGVVFSVVGQVMGLLSECQYTRLDDLSETEKEDTHNMVIAAFKNWEKVVSFDNEASLINASAHFFSNILHTNSADIKVLTSQEIGGFDYPQVSVCSPDNIPSIYSMGSVKRLDDFGLHDIDHLDLRYDETLNFHGQVANSLTCEPESVTRAFSEDEGMQYFGADGSFQSGNSCFESDLHSAVNGFLLSRSASFAQRRWTMVFSVLKWFSIRRIVANKTHVRRFC